MSNILKMISKEVKRIGWIGTGAMGLPMAGHLIRKGYQISINTRTPSRA